MNQHPFCFDLLLPEGLLSRFDNHVVRTLSIMRDQYSDRQACETMLAREDTVLYEVYEVKRPEVAGELVSGLSIVHPGQVGDEYFMTKGHFHAVIDTAEIYCCLKGQGMMVMETPEGEWAVKELRPGRVLYVLPRWAHRTVNTSFEEDLITLFVYPANAGHDYGAIERRGFRKIVVNQNGRPTVVDNLDWNATRKG